MATLDTAHIESLLDAEKYDEAKALLDEAIRTPFSPIEQGAATVGMTRGYVDRINTINAQYRDALKIAIESIKRINKAESADIDLARLAEVRKSLYK